MRLSRRRFLTLASAACLLAPSAHATRWKGTALGSNAQIILDHPEAESIIRRALAEIDRLEDIFSLYRSSEITQLNDTGRLVAPSFEMLDCLAKARQIHRITEGRFDPTVQPMWRALAKAHSVGGSPDADALAAAHLATGFERITIDIAAVQLAPGQQITLNGIAQGYIADRIASLMQSEGVGDVLIDTGEILAIGAPSGHRGWPVTIAGEIAARALTGRALATSAPLGTVLDDAGQIGHIVNPITGQTPLHGVRQVSVSAKSAALADGLSTGLCLVKSEAEAQRMLRQIDDARLESFCIAAGNE